MFYLRSLKCLVTFDFSIEYYDNVWSGNHHRSLVNYGHDMVRSY